MEYITITSSKRARGLTVAVLVLSRESARQIYMPTGVTGEHESWDIRIPYTWGLVCAHVRVPGLLYRSVKYVFIPEHKASGKKFQITY